MQVLMYNRNLPGENEGTEAYVCALLEGIPQEHHRRGCSEMLFDASYCYTLHERMQTITRPRMYNIR